MYSGFHHDIKSFDIVYQITAKDYTTTISQYYHLNCSGGLIIKLEKLISILSYSGEINGRDQNLIIEVLKFIQSEY